MISLTYSLAVFDMSFCIHDQIFDMLIISNTVYRTCCLFLIVVWSFFELLHLGISLQVGEDFLQTATLLTTNMNPSYCLPPAFPNPGSDPSLSNFDLGMPVHGDFSTDTSHTMKLDDGCSKEEPETELTLCTGGEMSKGKWKIEELDTELTLSIGGEWNRSKLKVMVEKKFASFLSMESNQSSAAPDKSGSKKASERER